VGRKETSELAFFVKIITLDFAFDVKQEKSSCFISVNTESIRNSSLPIVVLLSRALLWYI